MVLELEQSEVVEELQVDHFHVLFLDLVRLSVQLGFEGLAGPDAADAGLNRILLTITHQTLPSAYANFPSSYRSYTSTCARSASAYQT